MATDELEPALADACARARAAAPGVKLDERALAERLAATLAEEADPVAALAELHVEDLFVAIAAARGDRAAIERIDQRVRREVAAVTRSHGASGGFADDLEGEVRALVLAPRDGLRRGSAAMPGAARWMAGCASPRRARRSACASAPSATVAAATTSSKRWRASARRSSTTSRRRIASTSVAASRARCAGSTTASAT